MFAALVILKEPMGFWNLRGPTPICLPETNENLNLVGSMGRVAGWVC